MQKNPGNITQFSYDALSRATKIEERTASSVTSTKQHLWCGTQRCEARDASGSLSNGKQFLAQGQVNFVSSTPTNYFYITDHLGSIREMTKTVSGTTTIEAQYGYAPYGQVAKLTGSQDADFQYAGYYVDGKSGLNLTLFRQYNPGVGRWLSKDPLGEFAGHNLFTYVGGNPISAVDVLGLADDTILDYPTIKAMIDAGDNKSKILSDEFVICQIYRESTFYTSHKSSAGAVGLMGITPIAAKQVGSIFSEMTIPAKNIRAGTRYDDYAIKHEGGDIKKGIQYYSNYTKGYHDDIAKCEKCLQKKEKGKCPNPQKCLDMAAGN